MKSTFLINKKLGETPLEALERTCAEHDLGPKTPLTYAGRLDPMAEGLLVVLVGEECKRKTEWLGLDKVYETEFLLGAETDTHDVLGVVRGVEGRETIAASQTDLNISRAQFETVLRTFLGKRTQAYPAYSSKPHRGRPLFALARAGKLPAEDEMPSREIEIYSIEVVGERQLSATELEKQILEKIARVKGDFRQAEIVAAWQEFFRKNQIGRKNGGADDCHFQLFALRIYCSSGTYIRSLAHEVGKRLGAGALTFSIKRTKIGTFTL